MTDKSLERVLPPCAVGDRSRAPDWFF
jgi:hypothetical protein